MTPFFVDDAVTVYAGDCLDVLATLPDASVDAVVTDPPYGLEFMGREWDGADGFRRSLNPADAERESVFGRTSRTSPEYQMGRARIRTRVDGRTNPREGKSATSTPEAYVAGPVYQIWCQTWAAQCLRVLKPGGHLLAFGGTRTWHRLTCAIEDAGFEIRDTIAWLYGSGFPKSLAVDKAIDRAAGAQREVIGMAADFALDGATRKTDGSHVAPFESQGMGPYADRWSAPVTAPATDDARRWAGWGTALKPAVENIVVGRKPVSLLDRIGSRLAVLEDECRRLANGAGQSSAPTRHGSPEERTGSVPVSAATQLEDDPQSTTGTGEAADSSAPTDTSWSEWAATTCSNIVTSWKRSLAVLCEPTSTSTTATTSRTTTDLTTLLSSLSRITGPSTLVDRMSPDGLSSHARVVDDLFGVALLNWRVTQTLIAAELATEPTPQTFPAGQGSRLAHEPIVVARKPLQGTVAANVLAHGTGGLNVDGCRVEGSKRSPEFRTTIGDTESRGTMSGGPMARLNPSGDAGRWPANVLLDEAAAAELDRQSGTSASAAGVQRYRRAETTGWLGQGGAFTPGREWEAEGYGDTGGASRFFPVFRYEPKAPTSERPRVDGDAHETVKPLDLMRWLVRLVTPPGGLVLDPFAGSGTTAEACVVEGFRCVAVERAGKYLPLIVARLSKPIQPTLGVC